MPKDQSEATYNLECMKQDIEAMFLCSHIVKEYNERLLSGGSVDSRQLVDFVHSFIYEVPTGPFKYVYGENFIPGRYSKYNNNAGWTAGAGLDYD